MYVCMYVPGDHKDQKRTSDPLELVVRTVVSCYVEAENQAWVLWKTDRPVFLTSEPSF